jgi:hypothetical protein
MMRGGPLGVHNGSFPNLDYTVASAKSSLHCGLCQLNVGPLIPVVVDIVRDLAEEYAIVTQDAQSFLNEGGVKV